ncbi:DnaD domain protein [Pseudoflavonifractor capillosus ATCC 29799]|uniref:DnaD domain protein n=1 Tax=Pseudoflavonifractor capillosus ATCC 29799 TaxID=411467 RepID=A6NT93_9FIRM|nr:DnaD domain protein [Pseudoflavonifractor capillosus]EDN00656.1 DnaD domain protein [Pseudoflavonifractor capillosus ATCC 29799]
MAANLFLPGGVVAMPAEAADRLIASGSGDAALLYLYLLRKNGAASLEEAGNALRWDGARLTTAWDVLSGKGLAPAMPQAAPTKPLQEEPPEYTAEDIARELDDQNSPFPALVGEVQRRLGKILSTVELKTLYTIYDFLALPAEVICLLVSWCVEEMERKYGQGRKPRMSQISKQAFVWHRLGVDTAEAADAYIKRQAELHTREGQVLALLGITGRPAVEVERKYIAAWDDMGFGDEVIRMAYERTVLKKQTMSWPYMNSILRSWHQKGLHTPAEIETGDAAPMRPQGPAPNAPAPAGPGADRDAGHMTGDIQWMKDFLARQKSEQGGN